MRFLPAKFLFLLGLSISLGGVIEAKETISLLSSGHEDPGMSSRFVAIPMARDTALSPVGFQVQTADGTLVPSSARVMTRWPESSSIRWIGIDFSASHTTSETSYQVVWDPSASEPPVSDASRESIQVQREPEGYRVVTGPAEYFLPHHGALIQSAALDLNQDGKFSEDERLIENSAGNDLYMIDSQNRFATIGADPTPQQLIYENENEERTEGSPVIRAVFLREGWYTTEDGTHVARHQTRLIFGAGESDVKVEHALIFSTSTEDLQFKDYGMRLQFSPRFSPQNVLTQESFDNPIIQNIPLEKNSREISLFQERSFYFSKTDPEKDSYFEIAQTTNGDNSKKVLHSGTFAPNWLATQSAHATIGFALRNFWQTYPKEISTDTNSITLKLWSGRAGRLMDFRTASIIEQLPKDWYNPEYTTQLYIGHTEKAKGEAMGKARSHDFRILLDRLVSAEVLASRAKSVQDPIVVIADPWWLRKTEAMGSYRPYDPERFPEQESFMEAWFDQHMKVWRQWGDYGFFDFGSWPHVWYRIANDGPLEGRWYPYLARYAGVIDYGFHSHSWRMFMRSGNRKYFDAAEEVSRQRLDLTMVHYDDLPEDLVIGRRLPPRMKGAYSYSTTPVYWAGNTAFHNQSGTDIRFLAYLYYASDYRPARTMLENYGEAAKTVWRSGQLGAFRGTRPFASLKNLATVYQETGDPYLKQIVQEQVDYLMDLNAPQGVGIDKELTRLAKYGPKVGAMHRVYEVMGYQPAAKSLLKGSYTRATNTLGEGPFSYYNVEGEQFSMAYRLTKDPLYLRTMQRNMELALSEYRAPSDNPAEFKWKEMWGGVGPSVSTNTYPMGGMAFSLDILAEYEDTTDKKVPSIPITRQGGFGFPVVAAIQKPADKEVYLDVRSLSVLHPKVYDAEGNEVKQIKATPFPDQLYSQTKAETRYEILLPSNLPEGTYYLESGAHGAMWEITWTDAPHAVLLAPQGILHGSGASKQWGTRIVNGRPDREAPLLFRLAPDSKDFQIFLSQNSTLTAPDGSIQHIEVKSPSWHSIQVPTSENSTGLWKLNSPRIQYIQLKNALPVFSYDQPDHFFLPENYESILTKLPELKVRPTITATPLADSETPFFTHSQTTGTPAASLLLSGKTGLRIPVADPEKSPIPPSSQGTIELWFAPTWSSVEGFDQNAALRTILQTNALEVVIHKYGELGITATLFPDKTNSKATAPVSTNIGACLAANTWNHLAIQWHTDKDGILTLELFLNGVGQTYGIGDIGMSEKSGKGFVPAPFSEDIFVGCSTRHTYNIESYMAGIRFSNTVRYKKDFVPDFQSTTRIDESTLLSFPLKETLQGVNASGKPAVTATLTPQPK